MNPLGQIYTTVSNHRTHVAVGKDYVGSVNSYQCCLTKLVARLFRRSIRVNFDGKERSINRGEYLSLLHNLGHTEISKRNIDQCRNFRSMIEGVKLSQGIRMTQAIAESDRRGLFYKLAEAISRGEIVKAQEMIGKGAALDMQYCDRGRFGVSFGSCKQGLSSEKAYDFKVFEGAPILQAARKGYTSIVQQLLEFGAMANTVGRGYTFHRVITGVYRYNELDYRPHYVHDPYGYLDVRYSPDLVERTIVHTKDETTPIVEYRLNESHQLVRVNT